MSDNEAVPSNSLPVKLASQSLCPLVAGSGLMTARDAP